MYANEKKTKDPGMNTCNFSHLILHKDAEKQKAS